MYQKTARFNCNFKYEDHCNHKYNNKCNYNSNTSPAALAISVLTVAGGFAVHREVIAPHRGYVKTMDCLL